MNGGRWELVGVPYTSMRTPGGIANAIAVLREHGLAQRLASAGVADGGNLALRAPNGVRGASGLLNEEALAHLFETVRARVADRVAAGGFPLLAGGDCPVILGALAGLRSAGARPGLVLVDGHEDAWPPRASPTGEASDSEVAIALGRVDSLPGSIAASVPLLDADAIAMFGPRDAREIAEAGLSSLSDEVAYFSPGDDGEPATADAELAAALASLQADGFWLHVDLDVLATDAFRAVDYPQPGGFGWPRLEAIAMAAVRDARCMGASVVIYNPDLDPDRSDARRLVEFVAALAGEATSLT